MPSARTYSLISDADLKFKHIVLLALAGLTPIAIAIALATSDIASGFDNNVLSSSAVFAGVQNGQQTVVALVDPNSLPKLRVGQPAQVFVPTLEVHLTGRVAAIRPAAETLPAGFDPRWLDGPASADQSRLAQILIALDVADPRLTPGSSVGVRISIAGG
jgi:hypothetical protein